jgi:GAF domain-containing protein
MITKLSSLNPKEVLSNSIEVLESIMESDEVAIYILSDSKYYVTLAAKSGKKDFNVPDIVNIKEREDIYRVIETKDIYINYKWQLPLPVMAVPITDGGNVIAVACVYFVAFENITLYRQNLLRAAANLISYALENAYRFSEAAQEKYINFSDAAENGIHIVKQNR